MIHRHGLPSATGDASVPPSDDALVEQARRQVKGPAIGLLIAGMLTCLAIPLVVAIALVQLVSPHDVGTGVPIVGILPAIIILSITLVPGILTIVAAVRMKRLQAFGLAVTASILTIIASPACFLIGLPIGVWALVVLSQRDVRAAFAQDRARSTGTPGAGDSEGAFDAPQAAVPRLSKTALTGAIWAGPFFLIIILSLCGITLWATLSVSHLLPLLSPILLLLLATPIGVPILGYVALSQIRHSASRLYGLELALFDLWAFPLLALDAAIAGLGVFAAGACTGSFGGVVALLSIVVACVVIDFLIVRWVWRAVNRPPAGALPVDQPRRGRLKTMLSVAVPVLTFCLGVFGFAFLLWSVTERIENSRARIHTRILEADAKLVDELVPRPTRQPAHAHAHDSALLIPGRDPQTAQVKAAVFGRLLADGANPPGLLDDQAREGNWWPKQATSSHYFRRDKVAGYGLVDGYLGVRRHKDILQMRVQYEVLHGMNGPYEYALIDWEGSVPPPETARAFFIPYSRRDGAARYLVIALEVGDETENEGGISKVHAEKQFAAPTADGPPQVSPPLALSRSAFSARLPSSVTVELLGVSENSSQGCPWWRADGSPLAERPYEWLGTSVAASQNEMAREFAIRLSNTPVEPVGVQWKIDPSLALSTRETPGLVPSVPDVHGVAARMLVSQQTGNVHVGIAVGAWQTIAESQGRGGDVIGGKHNVVFSPGEKKDKAVTVTVTHDLIDAHGDGPQARIVAVGVDGREHPAEPSGNARAGKLAQLTVKFPNLSLKDVRAFRLQSRPYEWIEFRNVSLQPGQKTDVQVVSPGTSTPADGRETTTSDQAPPAVTDEKAIQGT